MRPTCEEGDILTVSAHGPVQIKIVFLPCVGLWTGGGGHWADGYFFVPLVEVFAWAHDEVGQDKN